MSNITASSVKSLRDKTGAGMMDCKKALTESNGDFEEAIVWLRKKGLSKAAKKSGRAAAEGLVSVIVDGSKAAIVELNAETDFVSRNEQFQDLAKKITEVVLSASNDDVEKIKNEKFPGSEKSVADEITSHIAVIGENMNLRRVGELNVEKGVVVPYIHNSIADGLGKIGVLVALESDGDTEKLSDIGKKVAMHIAAARPEVLNVEDVNAEMVERERSIFKEQARASGKPDNIIDKMVEGRIRKYYSEVVLNEQMFVMDDKKKVSEFLKSSSNEIGSPITLKSFIRFELGEGIEVEEGDSFAEEVAKMSK